MKISRQDLEAAAADGRIEPGQVSGLWAFLSGRQAHVPSFKAAHILYYLGGLIAIGAVSLFITLAWDAWSGLPMLLLGLGMAGVGVGLTERFRAQGLRLPSGVTITFAVATVPLIVYSFQQLIGAWDGDRLVTDYHRYIDWRWFYMELATLAAAAIAFWRYREPFVLMLVAVTLWYLSMDLVRLIQVEGGSWSDYYDLRRMVTFYMGILTIGLAFWVDLRSSHSQRNYAFWLYLVGVLMFWCGMTFTSSDSELAKFVYMLINLALIVVGAALRRRVFAVFGALGVAIYLGHLARFFQDSLLFPVALAAIGLLIIYAGIMWQKHETTLQAWFLARMPAALRALLERG
jgi:hypothetical protein